MIVNLHGLNSTGDNTAYKFLKTLPEIKVISPTYSVHNFTQGIKDLEKNCHFNEYESLLFIGTSTGALYAENLADKYHGSAVLINPVVSPKQLEQFKGLNKNHKTGVEYELTQEDIDTFPVNPLRHHARKIFIEEHDDILDHSLTIEKYIDWCDITKFEGSNHRFSHWEEILPDIEKFYYTVTGQVAE